MRELFRKNYNTLLKDIDHIKFAFVLVLFGFTCSWIFVEFSGGFHDVGQQNIVYVTFGMTVVVFFITLGFLHRLKFLRKKDLE